MPRPNFVEVIYHPIDKRGRRGPKTSSCIPISPDLTPRQIANMHLAGSPGKASIVEVRSIYRRRESVDPAMSAEQFRDWRRNMQYSTREAAYALGVTMRAVQYYETGERPVPSPIAKLVKWIENAQGGLD